MKQTPLLILVAAVSIALTYSLAPRQAPASAGPPVASPIADEYLFVPYGEPKGPIKIMDGVGVLTAVIGTPGIYQLCEGPIDQLKPIISALILSKDRGNERLDINVRVHNGLFLRPVKVRKANGGGLVAGAITMTAEFYSSLGPNLFEPSDAIGFTVIFRRGS